MLDQICPGILSHLLNTLRVFHEFQHSFCQHFIIARLHKNSSVRRFNQLSRDTVNREQRRTTSRHVIEDLVWVCGSEHRDILQDGKTNIRRSKDAWHLFFGAYSCKEDVAQFHMFRFRLEPRPFLPVTEQHKTDSVSYIKTDVISHGVHRDLRGRLIFSLATQSLSGAQN